MINTDLIDLDKFVGIEKLKERTKDLVQYEKYIKEFEKKFRYKKYNKKNKIVGYFPQYDLKYVDVKDPDKSSYWIIEAEGIFSGLIIDIGDFSNFVIKADNIYDLLLLIDLDEKHFNEIYKFSCGHMILKEFYCKIYQEEIFDSDLYFECKVKFIIFQ